MSKVIVIPARFASERLPGKPLADIHGLPMIVRTAQQASRAAVDRVVVAVDDQRVADVVQAHGFEAQLTAKSHPSGSDRTMEVASLLQLAADDVVINVQGDEPLLPPAVIDALLERMINVSNMPMATVAEPITRVADFVNPNVVKVVLDDQDQALYFSRAPIPFPRDQMDTIDDCSVLSLGAWRHVGMYAFRVAALDRFVSLGGGRLEHTEKLEQLRWLQAGMPLTVLRWPDTIPGGVDTPADLEAVRAVVQERDQRGD